MFNLQLVLYQKSGVFEMPPISGPRGSCMGTVVIIVVGYFVAFFGRRHWTTVLLTNTINYGGIIGCIQNSWFYVRRIYENELKLNVKDSKVVPASQVYKKMVKMVAPFWTVIALFAWIFLAQYPPSYESVVYGADMVQVEVTARSLPNKWMTPLTFTCLCVALSFFINGGMVVHAVLKKPHTNFHKSLVVYAAVGNGFSGWRGRKAVVDF